MENKKQNSIEWLVEKLSNKIGKNIIVVMHDEIEQAKAIHHQEIADAWNDGSYKSSLLGAEEYYNETFKNQDNE